MREFEDVGRDIERRHLHASGRGILYRKRLAFHPAKFEPAFSLARSDWQKRDTEQCAIAHGSEIAGGKVRVQSRMAI